MKKLIKLSAPVVVLLASFMIVKGLAAARPEPEKKDEETRLVSLYVDEAHAEQVKVSVLTQGEVRPKMEIDLVPQVSGRIVDMSEAFNEGAEFQAGALLLKIDDSDYKLAVVRAEAKVAQAQTELERQLATREIKESEWRDKRAQGEQPTDFSLNITQVRQAESMLQSAKAELAQAVNDLNRTEIRVPFLGRVRARTVGIGEYVSAGQSMGSVFSIDTAEVKLPLTDTQLVELNLPMGFMAGHGQAAPAVTFEAKLGNRSYQWTGRIVRVNAAVDEDTRLIYATAEVLDPYGASASDGMPLAVGLFVNARIEGATKQPAIVMPRLALRNKDKVFVINEENRLEIRTVEVLSTSEEQVLLSTGVISGEHVVTSTLPNAVEGMEVEPIFRPGQS